MIALPLGLLFLFASVWLCRYFWERWAAPLKAENKHLRELNDKLVEDRRAIQAAYEGFQRDVANGRFPVPPPRAPTSTELATLQQLWQQAPDVSAVFGNPTPPRHQASATLENTRKAKAIAESSKKKLTQLQQLTVEAGLISEDELLTEIFGGVSPKDEEAIAELFPEPPEDEPESIFD